MKIKVGDRVYDGKDQPIMVILSEADKRNILNMNEDATMYCSFPNTMDELTVLQWMKETN